MGTEGMKASLVSREVIADSIETRRARPPVRRPRLPRRLRQDDPGGGDGARPPRRPGARALQRHDLPRRPTRASERRRSSPCSRRSAPTAPARSPWTSCTRSRTPRARAPGACGGQFTANTMSTVLEFLGSVAGGSERHPGRATRPRTTAARRAGELVMDLVDARRPAVGRSSPGAPSRTRSRRSPATGGSTNGVLHLLAIAREFGIPLDARRLRPDRRRARRSSPTCSRAVASRPRTSTTPAASRSSCASCSSAACSTATRATVDGRTLAEIAAAAVETPGQEVVVPDRDADQGRPAASRSCAARWRPTGCVIKLAGHERRAPPRPGPRLRLGERPATTPCSAAAIEPGDVVVIRYEGPVGGPGMQEMLSVTAALVGEGLGDDGRAAHRRSLQRRDARPDDRPRRAGGGARRADRAWSRRATTIIIDVEESARPRRASRPSWRAGGRRGRRRHLATQAA